MHYELISTLPEQLVQRLETGRCSGPQMCLQLVLVGVHTELLALIEQQSALLEASQAEHLTGDHGRVGDDNEHGHLDAAHVPA